MYAWPGRAVAEGEALALAVGVVWLLRPATTVAVFWRLALPPVGLTTIVVAMNQTKSRMIAAVTRQAAEAKKPRRTWLER
jgi:hypothetical protein